MTVQGRWVDALRFDGGRLLVPPDDGSAAAQFAAWIKPDAGVSGEQVIIAAGPPRELVYDGTNRRSSTTSRASDGRTAAAASLPGKLRRATSTRHCSSCGGVRASGEVVVAIEGRMFSSGQFAGSIASRQTARRSRSARPPTAPNRSAA